MIYVLWCEGIAVIKSGKIFKIINYNKSPIIDGKLICKGRW